MKNQLQQDILTLLLRKGPMSTADICDELKVYGYGGVKNWDEYKIHVSKNISKMKEKNMVTGIDRPNPGTKPLRIWSAAPFNPAEIVEHDPEPDAFANAEASHEAVTAIPPEHYTEMASDVAEIELPSETAILEQDQHHEMQFCISPITLIDAMMMVDRVGITNDQVGVYLRGMIAAERLHGITE